jgi:deoxyribodipyrimidine photo-lyase
MEQQQADCLIGQDYPRPVVPLEEAAKHAREQLWKIINSKKVKENNERVLGTLSGPRHVSEKGA